MKTITKENKGKTLKSYSLGSEVSRDNPVNSWKHICKSTGGIQHDRASKLGNSFTEAYPCFEAWTGRLGQAPPKALARHERS